MSYLEDYYSNYDEEGRLLSQHGQVEYRTTMKYIREALAGDKTKRILEVGAGTGRYSVTLAKEGWPVTAVELVEHNLNILKSKLDGTEDIRALQGNALDLSRYADASFDVVLCFGPLYHLHDPADRDRCIQEALRVCKPEGVLFFAFINHDAVFLSELNYDPNYFDNGDFDPETLRLRDFPFVFHTVPECREMLTRNGVHLLREAASDGASELMAERINAMTDTAYAQYLRYHFLTCEKPEMLGRSNHLLFVGEKACR